MTIPDVRINPQPVWRIVLSRIWRSGCFFGLFGLLLLALRLEPPEGVPAEAYRALAIFTFTVILWATELVPNPVASLFALVLLPMAGVITARQSFALFGNESVFFVLGALILSAAVYGSGVATRCALLIFRAYGRTPVQLVRAVFLFSAFSSFFILGNAVAAVVLPILLELIREAQLHRVHRNLPKTLILAMWWGSTVGSVATVLGGARTILSIAILDQITGRSIGFAGWMLHALPLSLGLIAAALILLLRTYKIPETNLDNVRPLLENRLIQFGRWRIKEQITSLVLLATVAGWILLGGKFGMAAIAISGVVGLFAFRIVTWGDVEGYVNWGVILMYGGAVAAGVALQNSGATGLLSGELTSRLGVSPLVFLIGLFLISKILTETMSNSATVAMLLPVALGLAPAMGADVVHTTLAIGIGSGLAYLLPSSSPNAALAYSTGYIEVSDLIKPAIWLTIVTLALFTAIAAWQWPLVGG